MATTRSLAEEATSFYLSTLDPFAPHAQNVGEHLRRPIQSLTKRILFGDPDNGRSSHPSDDSLQTENVEADGSVAADAASFDDAQRKSWRDYLISLGEEDDPRAPRDGAGTVLARSFSNESDCGTGGPRLGRRARARMEAFLASCALALPDDPLPPVPSMAPKSTQKKGEGQPSAVNPARNPVKAASEEAESLSLSTALSGFAVGDSGSRANATPGTINGKKAQLKVPSSPSGLLRQISGASSASSISKRVRRYPQIDRVDLSVRLELYCRALRRARLSIGDRQIAAEECTIDQETSKALRARVRIAVRAFVRTVGCVRDIRPVLTGLIRCMTKELLAVEVLGDDLRKSTARLVSEYEHMTSFASLAFLSSPDQSAESHLTPLLLKYIQYLQSDWKILVAGCELERMLCTVIDPDIRHLFKTAEFHSIGHLLDVCHDNRSHLDHIVLPPPDDMMEYCSDPNTVRQALRDLRRETITVNGRLLPPAHNLKELVKLLTEALNSRTLTLSYLGKKKRSKGKRKKVKSAIRKDPSEGPSASSLVPGNASATPLSCARDDHESDFLSSGNEGDTDDSFETTSKFAARPNSGPQEADAEASATMPPRINRHRRVSSFDDGSIDMVTRRLLVAASRTGTGGDAYFVVRDLFGGEDVEVLPSQSQPIYSSSRPSMVGQMPRRDSGGCGGTIEIIVRLASVVIKCHGRFDVFPTPLVEDCEPLIQLHTTTTETIGLQEIRSGDQASENATKGRDIIAAASVLVLTEKKTDKTGWRNLSIRPARYEAVQVWVTPS